MASINRLDRRSAPVVVRSVKEQLTTAIDPTASDPDRTRVAGVGAPGHLVPVTAADDLATEDVYGTASQRIPKVGVKLAQFRQRTGPSGLRPRQLQWNPAEGREGTSTYARPGCRPSATRTRDAPTA